MALPRSYLNLRPLHAGLYGHTKQANNRPLLEHHSIKQQFREMASGRPQSPQAYNILCITGLSYLVSTLAQTLAGEQPTSLLLVQGSGASEPKLPRTANVMFKPKPLLFEDDRSTTFAPGARNREVDVWMMVVVVALAVDPPPWTPDPRS
jgi:hypothetical protein